MVVALAVLLFRLGQGPLRDFDEATYAEIAREIGVFGDFVHLHFDFAPWYNKAPLYQWVTYLAYQPLGVGEFSARFVSALAGAGTVGLTYAIARTWLGRPAAAAAALLLLLSNLFVHAARFGTSDVLLTFWIWAAIYSYLRARASPRWWYGVGACCGLAFMTKDIASLVAPAAIAVAAVYELRGGILRLRQPWIALAIAVAIAAPWLLAMYLWQGGAFVQQFVGYMVIARARSQIEGHTGGLAFYGIWSVIGFYPWIYAAAAGAIEHVLVDLRARRTSIVFVAFSAILLALYTLVRSKLNWYLDPIFPAYALFAAGGLEWAARIRPAASRGTLAAAAIGPGASRGPTTGGLLPVVGIAAIAVAGIWVGPNSVRDLPHSVQIALTVMIVLAAAVGLALRGAVAPVLAAGAVAFAVVAAATIKPLYDLPQQPGAALGAAARVSQPTPLLLYVSSRARYPDDDISHSLTFYSQRPVNAVIGPDALNAAVPCGQTVDAVVDQRDLPGLGAGFAWRQSTSWFLLGLGTLTRNC